LCDFKKPKCKVKRWFQNDLEVDVDLNLGLKSLSLIQSPPPQRIQASPPLRHKDGGQALNPLTTASFLACGKKYKKI
jgi:hypothetical protein